MFVDLFNLGVQMWFVASSRDGAHDDLAVGESQRRGHCDLSDRVFACL